MFNMAKDPAFLFYTGDFTTGTQFFTDEQVGKYMRLLMAQHQHGHLSENHVIMICKSYDNDVMQKFTKDCNGKWYNERLDIEIDKRKKYAESRSNNKKGKKIISKSYDPHMENENTVFVLGNNNTQSTSNTKSERLNQFPTTDNFFIEISEAEVKALIEVYKIRKGILLTAHQVNEMYRVFKLTNLTGNKFYETPGDVTSHFKNWLPTQKIEQLISAEPVKKMVI